MLSKILKEIPQYSCNHRWRDTRENMLVAIMPVEMHLRMQRRFLNDLIQKKQIISLEFKEEKMGISTALIVSMSFAALFAALMMIE